MTKRPQYSSVSDVLRDIAPDDTFRTEFDKHVAARGLIKHLLGMRAVRGLSQRDVADAIGCTQSRISKLENANDADVRLGDLKAYANAVGCDLVAHPLPRDVKPVDKVKCHAVAIKRHMDDLARLARSDEEIAEGVAAFFYECFVNVFLMMGDSARQLPLRPDASPYIHLEINGIEGEQESDRPKCLGEIQDTAQAVLS